MRKIEAISYQRKITGYGKESTFPTEMTVSYVVGMKIPLPVNIVDTVSEIKEVTGGYEVGFEKGYVLWISADKDVEVLYGDKQD